MHRDFSEPRKSKTAPRETLNHESQAGAKKERQRLTVSRKIKNSFAPRPIQPAKKTRKGKQLNVHKI